MFTPEQQKAIIEKRHEIVVNYCKERGWIPADITMEQVMEIRKLPAWQKVPQEVGVRLDMSEFEGKYTTKQAADVIKKMKGKVAMVGMGSPIDVLNVLAMETPPLPVIMGSGMESGKTIGLISRMAAISADHSKGGVILVKPPIPIPEPTALTALPVFQYPPPTAQPIQPIRSGKEQRRERRKKERKNKSKK
jgi:hypothetical protein